MKTDLKFKRKSKKPDPNKPPMIPLTFRLPEHFAAQLQQQAERRGIHLSELLREISESWIQCA